MDFRVTALILVMLCVGGPAYSRDAAPEPADDRSAEAAAAVPERQAELPTQAWRQPGFVMDEVVATPIAVEFDAYAPREISVDLDALFRLHRSHVPAQTR